MIPLEVCVHSESESSVLTSVRAVRAAGARRIELCADMALDGLTPPESHIKIAREAFHDVDGLLVMIRPTASNFYYDNETIRLMEQQIAAAAHAGADGVVFGVLSSETGSVHIEKCRRLVVAAKSWGLEATFHRAFDAVSDWQQALDGLIELEVNRVLSSGIPWGVKKSALDGIEHLEQMLRYLQGRLELVVGGGVSADNVAVISARLSRIHPYFSLHAYSSVLDNGLVSQSKVSRLMHQGA